MGDEKDKNQSMVEALQEILEAARQNYQKKQQAKQAEQLRQDEQARMSEAPATQISMLVVSGDGDSIGNAVARAERTDDLEQVTQISTRIEAGQRAVVNWVLAHNGKMIQQGGDEFSFQISSDQLDALEEIRKLYFSETNHTCTVGVGSTISQAVNARELGKLTGKDQTRVWDENTNRELELRAQPQDEGKKIQEALAIQKTDALPDEWFGKAQATQQELPAVKPKWFFTK